MIKINFDIVLKILSVSLAVSEKKNDPYSLISENKKEF